MSDRLNQYHQKRQQSVHLSLTRSAWRWIVLVGALIILSALWLGFSRGSEQITQGPIVLVSGRDDHGLLVEPTVLLTRTIGQTDGVARLPDATFVRVVAERGEWLRVQTLGDAPQVGWIDNYYLRNRAMWLDARVQVQFVDARVNGKAVEVLVRPIDDSRPPTWVAAARLREIGAQDDHSDHHH